MYETDERFFDCIMRGENRFVNTFKELPYLRYHSHNLKCDLERFSCASR